MRWLIVAIILLTVFVSPAQAQQPTPAPGGGGITVERDSELPYTFETIDYETEGTPFSSQLNLFGNANFINLMGSTALTLFSLVDTQNVLAIFVVILLAMWLLWRIYKFTTTSTPSGNVDLNVYPDGSEVVAEEEEYVMERRYFSNPYKVYTTRLVKRR